MRTPKRVLGLVVIMLFTLGIFCVTAQAEGLKVGYIDVSTVFDEYKRTVDSDEALEKETQGKQEEREKKASKIKRMMDELELLSEKGRQEKQVEIDKKVDELKGYDMQTRRNLRKKRDEMVTDILKEIDDVVKEYAENNGFDLILNDTVLLYKKDAMNITQNILEILNKQYRR